MKKISKKQLLNLFKSGDFTIIYWDRSEPTIYKGKWEYRKEYKKDEYATMDKSTILYPMYEMNGYVPDIVKLLSEALGGKADTI